jgi:hypothetical protein
LIGVDELVREVLLGSVLPHLDSCSTDYPRVAGARLWLHSEKLPEQNPVGLDPQERFTEVHEDCGMENTVRVEVEVLDVVVPKKALEEIARRERESALPAKRANIGISSSAFSIGYGSPAAALHKSTSFSRMNPLLRRASKSSVFVFDFFHSRLGSGHGGDIGGAAPAAAPVASSRPLFFPAVFADLDGEGFILQVHDIFTRIRTGATLAALGGGALRSIAAAVCARGDSGLDLFAMATAAMGGNP